MKLTKTIILTAVTALALIITFPGCYTQLASLNDEQKEDNQYYSSKQNDSTAVYNQDTVLAEKKDRGGRYNNDYDDWYPRCRVGFSYYYPSYYWPSYAFSMAYADPWYYDSYWAYDPWFYGSSYYYPNYGYGYYYPNYYYSPYYSNYYSGGSANIRRTDGSIRYNGQRRGEIGAGSEILRAGSDIPEVTPVNLNSSGSASYGNSLGGVSNSNNGGTKTIENSRRTINNRNSGQRFEKFGSRGNEDKIFINRNRDAGQQNNSPMQNPSQPPPSYQLQPRDNSGKTPSYTPPAKPSANPAPANNGSRRSDGNNRSGSSQRNPRP